ncbi:putative RNA recognition motif domain, nucleotide-binding alpha-beta plait domain superfamily [Helianthus annuus]|nr:putative RNA recognition motif domain, nucleotide-binding alpha-beta plait domain superfamily [Helianthus annuus]
MAERDKMDEEWRDVPTKRNYKGGNKEKRIDSNVTKYFVSKLPFGCTPWEVTEFLGHYGEVAGSYIARKNDKEGNRFGFVSFKNVKNAKELEYRMNGVKMGKFILKVNIAKFAVENAGLFEGGDPSLNKNRPVSMGREHCQQDISQQKWAGENSRGFQKEGRSFVDLFKGKGTDNRGASTSNDPCSGKSLTISEDVKAFQFLHGRALVGRTVNIDILNKLDRILWEGGFSGVVIHYVGGLSLLVSFKDNEAAADFLSKKDVWRQWFSVLDLWEGQTLAFERIAWLNIFGVPLHLADNIVFNDIASQFGTVVKHAQLSVDDDDLSFACVGVLIGDGKEVKESVTLKWKHRCFQVWVSEVSDVWIPECMGVVGLKSDILMEESIPQSSEFSPVEGDLQMDNEKSRKGEELGLNENLHGNQSSNSGIHNRVVGPEEGTQQEREFGGFVCQVLDTGKKKKRRPKPKSPVRDKSISVNKSPSEEERPSKRPRASSSDPFDFNRFIDNWKALSEASNKDQGDNFQENLGGFDLNQMAFSVNSQAASHQVDAVVEVEEDGGTLSSRGFIDPVRSC